MSELNFLPLAKLIQNPIYARQCKKEYLLACKFFGCTLIDRTNTLNIGRLKFAVVDPILDLPKTSLTFEQIALQRASHLLDLSLKTSKKIVVLWSGGIDSTVALIALMRVAEERQMIQQLSVLLSQDSITEFPTFFHQIIQKKLNHHIYSPPLYPLLQDKTTLFVTGEHGDQLFGSDKSKYYVLLGDAFKPYQEILPFMISRKLGTEKYTQKIMQFLEPQIQKSPISIHTLYDYLWWMNFSQKWQHVFFRLSSKIPDLVMEEDMIHFFSSTNFQSWSISNHHQKIDKAWNTYKKVAKEFIYTFFDDKNYFLYKEKEASLKDAIVYHQKVKCDVALKRFLATFIS